MRKSTPLRVEKRLRPVVPMGRNRVGPLPRNRVVPFKRNQVGPITRNPAVRRTIGHRGFSNERTIDWRRSDDRCSTAGRPSCTFPVEVLAQFASPPSFLGGHIGMGACRCRGRKFLRRDFRLLYLPGNAPVSANDPVFPGVGIGRPLSTRRRPHDHIMATSARTSNNRFERARAASSVRQGASR